MNEDLRLLYASVAARRTAFDSLVWQVPILSLTAQAFLFTIALGGDSTRLARTISSGLSLIITVLSIILMARHRQSEITDAQWLADREQELGIPDAQRAHGSHWRSQRDAVAGTPVLGPLRVPHIPGFQTWVLGLALFGLAALVILVITALAPAMLS